MNFSFKTLIVPVLASCLFAACGNDQSGFGGGGGTGTNAWNPKGPWVFDPAYVRVVDGSDAPIAQAIVWFSNADAHFAEVDVPTDADISPCDYNDLTSEEKSDYWESRSSLSCSDDEGKSMLALVDGNCGPDGLIDLKVKSNGVTKTFADISCAELIETTPEERMDFVVI